MSVYRVGKTWWFQFRFKGRRFRRSAFTTDKALAERVEARARLEAAEQSAFPRKQEMTLAEALLRYYEEHAKHLPAAYTIDRQIEKLQDIGTRLNLSEIDDRCIADYIARRRGQKARNKETLVNPGTINREIQTLRAVINRAADQWSVEVGRVKWKAHRLTESPARRRYLTDDEQARLIEAVRPDIRPLLEFCLLTGARLMSAIRLTWSDIDYGAGSITFRKFKGGTHHTIPISRNTKVLLGNQAGLHPIYVFTYLCHKTRGQRVKGERYPFSKDGWRRIWARAVEKAALGSFRFHDQRHTALSRITKRAGIATAAKLAGHASITTTTRYAHVLMDDVRAAMDGPESGHTINEKNDKPLIENAND
jgi:integrase